MYMIFMDMIMIVLLAQLLYIQHMYMCVYKQVSQNVRILCYNVQPRMMSQLPHTNSNNTNPNPTATNNKNIKNIYVHKINSLMKMSRESLAQEENRGNTATTTHHNINNINSINSINNINNLNENANAHINQNGRTTKRDPQLRIKKIYSQIDKTTLKLQKNRESARKARQRKNLYIKLLQSQVSLLKKQLSECDSTQNSSTAYLRRIINSAPCTSSSRSNTVEDDLDRYLSQENISTLKEQKQRAQKKVRILEGLVEEYGMWYAPDMLSGITSLERTQRGELNMKMVSRVIQEENQIKSKLISMEIPTNLQMKLLLPFQEDSPNEKISNIVKSLTKTTEETHQLLAQLNTITHQLTSSIIEQSAEQCEQYDQISKNRIKSLIEQLKIVKVGDKVEKVIQRVLKWGDFKRIDIRQTLKKMVQFGRVIEKRVVEDENVGKREKERQKSKKEKGKQGERSRDIQEEGMNEEGDDDDDEDI